MVAIAHVLLLLVGSWLLLIAVYLVALTIAGLFLPSRLPPDANGTTRFAILVPAHNEERLIARLLDNLRRLDYPSSAFHIFVVADNCADDTAAIARSRGVAVYERSDRSREGKGFALRWLLEQVGEERHAYDAFVILDADSVVASDFLRRMDARLSAGSLAIQAYYSVLNRDKSPIASLRYAALASLHYLRPLARSALGLSCGLKGNGMCFAAPILERFAWRWFTLAEDVEFHLALVREGLRVDFAPETSVLADMPISLAQARTQNTRWERGRLQLLRDQVPGLIADGLRRRSALRLDAAAEQLIPPLSVPFAAGVACVAGGWALGSGVVVALAAIGVAALPLHLLAGMVAVGAPASAYRALAYAPMYIAWKAALYGRAALGPQAARWIRTERGPDSHDVGGGTATPAAGRDSD